MTPETRRVVLDAIHDWYRLVDAADVPCSHIRRALALASLPCSERATLGILHQLVADGDLAWGSASGLGGVRDVRLVRREAVRR